MLRILRIVIEMEEDIMDLIGYGLCLVFILAFCWSAYTHVTGLGIENTIYPFSSFTEERIREQCIEKCEIEGGKIELFSYITSVDYCLINNTVIPCPKFVNARGYE